jgi:signal transduction histidine kinase
MKDQGYEVIVSFVAITLVLVLLFIFLLALVSLFQRRQAQFRAEKQALREAYQREILQAQIETQNQTLRHLGEELHDHIGQLLSVAILQLNVLDEELEKTPHASTIQQTGSLMGQILNDLRALSKTLNTDAVSRLGLHDSINLELERIRRTGRYQTELSVSGEPYPLNPQTAIVLFRMVQETISNTLKHARAKTIRVVLDYEPGCFRVGVADDGRGFQPKQTPDVTPTGNGQGLSNLHRRASLLGGSCTVLSQPGDGCIVTITIPIVAQDQKT